MIKNLNPLTFSEYGSVHTSAEYACLKKEASKTITFTEASPLFYTGEYQLYLDVVEYPTLLEIMYEQDCLSAQNYDIYLLDKPVSLHSKSIFGLSLCTQNVLWNFIRAESL